MSDKEISAIVHELAGILSSLQGFAEIVGRDPDNPQREDFIGIVRKDARRAAQAVKDLQILRAFDSGRLVDAVEAVSLEEAFAEAATFVEERSPLDEARVVVAELPAVLADRSFFAEAIARCSNLAGDSPIDARLSDGAVELVFAFPQEAKPEDIERGVVEGQGPFRALAIARLLLGRWGGDVRVEAGPHVVFSLKQANA